MVYYCGKLRREAPDLIPYIEAGKLKARAALALLAVPADIRCCVVEQGPAAVKALRRDLDDARQYGVSVEDVCIAWATRLAASDVTALVQSHGEPR
jgi:hypothetical protein